MADDHFKSIYRNHADTYQEMISFEDIDANLPQTLRGITSFIDLPVLDLGSGTGRLPQLFREAKFTCIDLHRAMLLESLRQREKTDGNWSLLQADGRQLPISTSTFQIVNAGWAFGHFVGWFPGSWETEIGRVLKEMYRVLAPEGVIIILETMSTGSLEPAPPHEGLAAYYHLLEHEHGFLRKVISTDYLFDNLERACKYANFFFGEELAQKVWENNWQRLPEWTGIWSKRL